MKKQQPYKCIYGITGLLVFFCVFSILMLASSSIHADDDVVDDVNVSVPVSCTLNGVGMDTHNATIIPGQVNSSIGESTITAFCNDADGFSIYAIGFSLDDEGETSMISSSVGYSSIIQTGTSKVGNESQWAMKILPDSTNNPLYPITIRDEYSDFYSVPDDYDRVAWRTSSTDVGSYAVGSTFRTTYQAYISPLQAPDTFVGKVKYMLVHPNSVESEDIRGATTFVFNGGDYTFPDGSNTNTLKMAKVCDPSISASVGNSYEEVMTSNISAGGSQTGGAYTDSEQVYRTISFPDADKILVEVNYIASSGLNYDIETRKYNEGEIDEEKDDARPYHRSFYVYENSSGNKSYLFDDNSINIGIHSFAQPESGYDYGVYMKIYPVYFGSHEDSTYRSLPSLCSVKIISGGYKDLGPWPSGSHWEDEDSIFYVDGGEEFEIGKKILSVIGEGDWNQWEDIRPEYKGLTINLYPIITYELAYDGNGATAGSMEYHKESIVSLEDPIFINAPNYYKTNFGFAGWSFNSDTSIGGSDKIFGPNEPIVGADISFSSNHEATFYAIWVPKAGSMQNWQGCSAMSSGEITALTDTRDNNTYAVAKLADGKCWMIENLRLEAEHSSNSALASGFGGQFIGLAESESSNFSNTTSPNSLYNSGSSSTSTSVGIGSTNAANRIPRYSNYNTFEGIAYADGTAEYGLGNYYNFAAARASTYNIRGNSGGLVGGGSGDDNTSSSICPAGWSLPSQANFNNLINNINSDSSQSFLGYPNNFTLAGYYSSFSRINNGWQGYYWATSPHTTDNTLSYSIRLTSSSSEVLTANRYYGYSVRCVAD